ncbi:MAG: hypothetical protein JNK57_15205 [Planctomycetaceae bacterium]|nr:hypothetical protein [Planctomycetaceae bacterium]
MSKDQILILSVVMTFSALLGFMAWVTFTGNLTPLGFAMMWTFRILGPLGFIGGAALYFKLKYRRDLAPDYLGAICTPYFGQNGLCLRPFRRPIMETLALTPTSCPNSINLRRQRLSSVQRPKDSCKNEQTFPQLLFQSSVRRVVLVASVSRFLSRSICKVKRNAWK